MIVPLATLSKIPKKPVERDSCELLQLSTLHKNLFINYCNEVEGQATSCNFQKITFQKI